MWLIYNGLVSRSQSFSYSPRMLIYKFHLTTRVILCVFTCHAYFIRKLTLRPRALKCATMEFLQFVTLSRYLLWHDVAGFASVRNGFIIAMPHHLSVKINLIVFSLLLARRITQQLVTWFYCNKMFRCLKGKSKDKI